MIYDSFLTMLFQSTKLEQKLFLGSLQNLLILRCTCLCRIQMGEQTYMEAFNSELEAFKDRIRIRAKEKMEKAIQEYEEVIKEVTDMPIDMYVIGLTNIQ